jgi:hypothetical protein
MIVRWKAFEGEEQKKRAAHQTVLAILISIAGLIYHTLTDFVKASNFIMATRQTNLVNPNAGE